MSKQPEPQHGPLPCEQWAARLAATHPRDLTFDEQQALRAHVALCPACAAVLNEYHVMDASIRALPAIEPLPASSLESIVRIPVAPTMQSEGYAQVEQARWSAALDRSAWPRRVVRFASMVAAVLIVGAIVGSFLLVLTMHRSQTGNTGAQTPVKSLPATSAGKQLLVCPPAGSARAAIMPPLTLGADSNVVYVDNEQSAASPKADLALLMRYDVVTHSRISILKLPDAAIIDAEVSPDGQWVLFIAQRAAIGYEVQLVRIDGRDLQALVCSQNEFMYVSWSPDQQWALLSVDSNHVAALSLATGHLQTLDLSKLSSGGGSSIHPWIDGRHFVLEVSALDPKSNVITTIYSVDVTRWSQHQPGDVLQLAGPLTGAVNYALSADGTRLYISQCGGGPKAVVLPCTISVLSISGGKPRVIFQTPSMAITRLYAYGNGGLLFVADNVAGNTGQNGIWKLNSDGTGLTRLLSTTDSTPTLFNLFAQDSWANVSRDGRWYALKVEVNSSDTLAIGSMNGGPLATIATRGQDGWSQSGAIGWTTM